MLSIITKVFPGVISLFTLKYLPQHPEDQLSLTQPAMMLPLLRNPSLLIALSSATCAAFAVGYIESLLQIHLYTFALGLPTVGLCFLAMSGTYTVCTIATGWIIDTRLVRIGYIDFGSKLCLRIRPWTMCVYGLGLILISFSLVGPVPLLPLSPSLALTVCSLVVYGAGSACVLITN